MTTFSVTSCVSLKNHFPPVFETLSTTKGAQWRERRVLSTAEKKTKKWGGLSLSSDKWRHAGRGSHNLSEKNVKPKEAAQLFGSVWASRAGKSVRERLKVASSSLFFPKQDFIKERKGYFTHIRKQQEKVHRLQVSDADEDFLNILSNKKDFWLC